MDGTVLDDEDEQMKLAIALSLQDSSPKGSDQTTNSTVSRQSIPVPSGSRPNSSILGLDRRAMETERLARLERNLNSQSTMSVKRPLQNDDQTGTSTLPPSKRACPTSKPPTSKVDATATVARSSSPAYLRFPHGIVKKTWCLGFERSGSDVKIEEVLEKNTLQLAVLSSFLWDAEWILRKIEHWTKVIMVVSAKDEEMRNYYSHAAEAETQRSVRVIFPPMPGNVNCMHSKLMLLAHPTHLRIAVPTANLVPFDWGETGVMENSVFLIDLPRLPDGQETKPEKLTIFGQELWHFCGAMGLNSKTLQSLCNFDFAATKNMAFVHTVGGEHRSEAAWRRTGYPGLGSAVRQLGLQTDIAVRIDFVASSIGAVTKDLLHMIYLACKGDDGLTEYNRRTGSRPRSTKSSLAGTSGDDKQAQIDDAAIRRGFAIYFPSETTVRNSRGGSSEGGTICFQERWYSATTFDKSLMRDCRSVREGLLMHNKIIFVQEVRDIPEEKTDRRCAWAYVGSANCSESAWGRLVKDRVSKQPKLTCRNWECGVLLPLGLGNTGSDSTSNEALELQNLSRFEATVPVPMELPATTFSDNGLKPWFFNQSTPQ